MTGYRATGDSGGIRPAGNYRPGNYYEGDLVKRYYFPNRTVKARGYSLKVTSGGTVYHDDHGTFRRLNTLWLKRWGRLSVELPNGKCVHLRPERDGKITVIENLAEAKS
jgi:hypothetical protein